MILICESYVAKLPVYYHAKFQDAEGLKKKRDIRHCSLDCKKFIEFLLGQYTVLLVDDRGKYE